MSFSNFNLPSHFLCAGPVPAELCKLTNLTKLLLARNALTGEFEISSDGDHYSPHVPSRTRPVVSFCLSPSALAGELPLELLAFGRSWTRLSLTLELPPGVHCRGWEPARGLHESGAGFEVESRGQRVQVTLTRLPESDPVPNGPLARLLLAVDEDVEHDAPIACGPLLRDGQPQGSPSQRGWVVD